MNEPVSITVNSNQPLVIKHTGVALWIGQLVVAYKTIRQKNRCVVDVIPQNFQMIASPEQLAFANKVSMFPMDKIDFDAHYALVNNSGVHIGRCHYDEVYGANTFHSAEGSSMWVREPLTTATQLYKIDFDTPILA